MKLTKKKIIVLIALLASLFPLFLVFVYFVPLNVVWISADKELESQLKIYLYQEREMTPSQLRQYRKEHRTPCYYENVNCITVKVPFFCSDRNMGNIVSC